MQKIKLLIGLLGLFFSNNLLAQRLAPKIPKDAFVVATINGRSFFELISVSQFNQSKIGQALITKLNRIGKGNIQGLEELGFNLDAQVYAYSTKTDSIRYYGMSVPLSNSTRVGDFLKTFGEPQKLNNGQWILDLNEKKQLLVWNEQTLYLLSAELRTSFFEDETTAKKYGLANKKLSDEYNDSVIDSTALKDSADVEWDAVDSLYNYDTGIDSATVEGYDEVLPAEEYEAADAARNAMYDTYYASIAADDSIKNELLKQWLHQEAIKLIESKEVFNDPAFNKSYRKNALASLWIRNVNELYHDFVPGVYNAYALLLGAKAKKFDTGFESANIYLTLAKNTLTVDGSIALASEQVSAYRNVYNRRLNKKFFKYLTEDAIAYTSIAVNTENYLRELPTLMQQYYGSLLGQYDKEVDLGSSIFSLLLDEKAIGKTIKGDGVFALTGIKEQEVKYTTYEYDEDYNSVEVEKTKKESIPAFLAMFSSNDMSLFKKTIALGIARGKVTENEGVYTISGLKGPFEVHILLKDGIVFIGTAFDDLLDIKYNRYKSNLSSKHKKILNDNKFAVLFNSKKIVKAVNSLDIPTTKRALALQEKIQALGDFYFTSKGIKGKKMLGSFQAEFPNSKNNALQYILDIVENESFRP
ncbi:hypothetical protein RYH73_13925 [Olivibacter sp. CPCC 100613]|uniref:hypothetical protein n=1 Tax=Olivibacter sp. CPCC 100613 TaxID=3079931 RepID=UPI002FF82923